MPSSRGSSRPRDQTRVSCTAERYFTAESPGKPNARRLSEVKGTQSCWTLYESMDCSPPGSSVHGILQARILAWVARPFSRGSSRPRDQTQVSRIAGGFFTVWAHMWDRLPLQVWCMRQGVQGWCTGMTLRDGMGREKGGGFRMGNTCTPMADSCQCMAKTLILLNTKTQKGFGR